MRDLSFIRKRYLQDELPTRLGGLAANLARIRSFSRHDSHSDGVAALIDESKHFIEWTAAEAETETAAQLVELQVQLSLWQRQWAHIWPDPERRQALAQESAEWSKRVLRMSGLLDD